MSTSRPRSYRAWPLIDLSHIASGVQTAVRNSPKPPKRQKESAYVKACKPTPRHRDDFEAQFLSANDDGRFHIQRIGHKWEVWDKDSSDVYGPFATHADARVWVRGRS
jgi:hypothetical protein